MQRHGNNVYPMTSYSYTGCYKSNRYLIYIHVTDYNYKVSCCEDSAITTCRFLSLGSYSGTGGICSLGGFGINPIKSNQY